MRYHPSFVVASRQNFSYAMRHIFLPHAGLSCRFELGEGYNEWWRIALRPSRESQQAAQGTRNNPNYSITTTVANVCIVSSRTTDRSTFRGGPAYRMVRSVTAPRVNTEVMVMIGFWLHKNSSGIHSSIRLAADMEDNVVRGRPIRCRLFIE